MQANEWSGRRFEGDSGIAVAIVRGDESWDVTGYRQVRGWNGVAQMR